MNKKRRNAITWNQFYELTKHNSCNHINLATVNDIERFFINSFILCKECLGKYKKLYNPKLLFNRELGNKN